MHLYPAYIFLFGFFILSSCVTESDKNVLGGKSLPPKEQEKLNEYKAEIDVGRNMAGRLLQFYGTYDDEKLVEYVNKVGNYVASYGDYPDRRYMFAILDSNSVNAFACPGGYILITLGTLRNVKSEAELAMVLGHEVAHVGKKHMFNTLKKMGEKEREEAAKEVEEKIMKSTSQSVLVRRRPKADTSETGDMVARYLSNSAGVGFSLLQAASAGMNLILEKGLDKDLEYEADLEGTKYAIRSGYNPKAFLNFFTRLQAAKAKDVVNTKVLEKTHPSIKSRKERISDLLVKMNSNSIFGADGESRFEAMVKALPPVQAKKKI